MANITGASLAPIYDRINATEKYHPYEAETFADWATEAGDAVTLKRGNKNYKSPVHSARLTWKGIPTMSLSSTGNQERESISKVSKNKYRKSGYGRRNNRENNGLWHYIEETDEYWRAVFGSDLYGLSSRIEQTAEYWRASFESAYYGLSSRIEQTAEYWRASFESAYYGLSSRIEQTAEYWRASFESAYYGLSSRIEQTAEYWRASFESAYSGLYSRIEMTAEYFRTEFGSLQSGFYTRVEQTDTYWRTALSAVLKNGKVTAASIATAINNQGLAGVKLSGDWIAIDGNTTLSGALSVSGGDFTLNGNLYVGLSGANYIQATTVKLVGASSSQGANIQLLGATDVQDMIIKAAVSGNNLQLWKHGDNLAGDPSITFSKATTLSGEWSGDNTGDTATYTVSASPQEVSNSSSVVLHINQNAAWVTDPDGTIRARLSNTPYANVSITAIGLASNYSALSDTETRSNIYIQADASNGAKKDDKLLQLAGPTTYNNGGKRCVNLMDGNDIIGRVNIDSTYTAGYNGAHLTGAWDKTASTLSRNNRITISKVSTGSSNSLNYVIAAGASITYNATTNKFVATGQAKVDGTVRGDDATASSGELTISFNNLQGSGASAYRTVSIKEGSTVRRTSGNLTDYGDGYSAGNSAGQTTGYNNAHLTGSWDKTSSSLSRNNRITISKTTSGSSNSLNYVISASASISYNSNTHKYTATAQAKVDGTVRGENDTDTSGTEAYADGWDAVGGNEVSLGSSSSYNGSITKSVDEVSGYVWIKNNAGTWVRKRTFSISNGATKYTAALYYYSNGSYHKINANKLCYSTS